MTMNFKLTKYDVFTPVQKNAIPIVMSECDVMACPGQFRKDCRVPAGSDQMRELNRGCNLDNIRFLVLDEVDSILEC
ncbi:Ded1-like DEAD-box RNA helicase [Culex quinquefasciatus]|uniref:Ded1-like DEAD-box RNA helicase n=1 Tax=Culex quinquefasciatus TaxID=7176 RepID=B0WQU1_CULQU|nr:Ded1-like DEAD-box RNA helicase [Culex quinquefasciatus]|eukprot:XP_001851075.1 Ded1-like DEAD-box RNA helicase [Culex quinquefasciatus]